MAKKTKNKSTKSKNSLQEDSKLFAFLAVFLSIVGFIIALITKKEDKYVIFYAKESLILFLTGIIAQVATLILAITIIGIILIPFVWLFVVTLWIFQIVNSLSGEKRPTPIIGEYAKKIKI